MVGWAGGLVLRNGERRVENVKGSTVWMVHQYKAEQIRVWSQFEKNVQTKSSGKAREKMILFFLILFIEFFKAILSEKIHQELKLYHWLNVTLRWPLCFGKTIHSLNKYAWPTSLTTSELTVTSDLCMALLSVRNVLLVHYHSILFILALKE